MSDIVVFGGAGASGRHIAANLHAAGHKVTIVDPAIQNLRKIGGHLNVAYSDSSTATVSFPDEQLLTPQELQGHKLSCDLVICVPKAFGLDEQLAKAVIDSTSPTAPILSLSNGVMPYALPTGTRLKNIEGIHAFADTLSMNGRELIGGVINYPATKTPEGVKVGVTPARVQEVGITIGKSASDVRVSEICSSAGIGCKIKERAADVAFGKLGDMLSVGPQALLDTTFIDAANTTTPTGKITDKILREYHAIAKASGIDLGEEGAFVAAMQDVMRKKGAFKGSMYPDIAAGTPTEKDAVHGALAELAQGQGVQAPAITKTYEMLEAVETKTIDINALRNQLRDVASADDFCNFQLSVQKPGVKRA